ncbi:MAG: hypothetical protein BWK78_05840 [Thiotrichaceae bacterium IS1]|nr:MAG: hypothetical protein BWK78_05840 [Thiotrichaceae bacterium IS1]
MNTKVVPYLLALTLLLPWVTWAEGDNDTEGLKRVWTSSATTEVTPPNTLHTFAAQEMAVLNWGTEPHQVGLDKVPGNNFGPQSLTIDQTGTLYLLDSANQRVSVLNTTGQPVLSIPVASKGASDLCIVDENHLYLLFREDKVVISQNWAGEINNFYPIITEMFPVGIQCHGELGLIVEAADGNSYLVSKAGTIGDQIEADNRTSLMFKGWLRGNRAFFLERQNGSQGMILVHNYVDNTDREISVTGKVGSLETLNLAGTDQVGNIYLSVEELVSDSLLVKQKVFRFLRKYTADGQLVGEVNLPYSLYALTTKDLVVTSAGEVFQALPLKDNLEIVKWEVAETAFRMLSGTGRQLSQKLFSYVERQDDDFYPSEGIGDISERMERSLTTLALDGPITRTQVIQNAKNYANASFSVGKTNVTTGTYDKSIARNVISAVTSSGNYTGAFYKWGGFNTIAEISTGLTNGKFAGDINAVGNSASSLAVGVDCSGFVSRIWELSSKRGTGNLPDLSTRITYNDLKPGDILNRSSDHVMVFSTRDSSGNYLVYESSATGWKVALNQRSAAYVGSYTPYRYTKILDELSVFDLWVKAAPIYAGLKGGFDAQFKLKNNTQVTVVAKVAMAIHDASGKFVSDMINVSSTIAPGGSSQTGKVVVDSPTPAGQYKVVAKVSTKQDSQRRDIWEELASAPFTVLPSLGVVDLWVKSGTPIYAGAKGGFDAQFKLKNLSNQSIVVPKVAMAIHDANGMFVKDMKVSVSVSLKPGEFYQMPKTAVDSPTIAGGYKVVAKVSWKTDTQGKDIWEEIASAWFTVTK